MVRSTIISCAGAAMLIALTVFVAETVSSQDPRDAQRQSDQSKAIQLRLERLRGSDFDVRREISLRAGKANKRFPIDVGEFPAGTSGRIEVTIKNTTESRQDFTGISAACACIQPSLSLKSIQPGESTVVTLSLNTASRLNKPESLVIVRVVGENDPTGSVDLLITYRLKSMLAFQQTTYAPEIDQDKKKGTILVPFYCTPPIDPTLLSTSIEPDLSWKASVEKGSDDDAVWMLKIDFETAKIPKGGITANIKLKELQLEREAQAVLVLSLQDPIRVIPRSIRFAPASENQLVANCIIKIDIKKKQPLNGDRIYAKALINGRNLTVRTDQMGMGVFKCQLSCSQDFIHTRLGEQASNGDQRLQVNWEIVYGRLRAELRSPVLVSQTTLFQSADAVSADE